MRTIEDNLPTISGHYANHTRTVAAAYQDAKPARGAALTYRKALAAHFRYFVPPQASVLEVGCGTGDLLKLLPNRDITGVDIAPAQLERARKQVPNGTFLLQAGESLDLGRTFDVVIVSDTFNLAADVFSILERIKVHCHERTRLVVSVQNQLWRPLLACASALGMRREPPVNNWIAPDDLKTLADQSGWQIVQTSASVLCPIPLLGLERFINRWIAPLARPFCLSAFVVARPLFSKTQASLPRVSVVIPARNESGNIEAAIQRTPEMGAGTQIIFVEGHSKDDTWQQILKVKDANPDRDIIAFQQSGKGKGNAVREAFAAASGDILMILDADLTMPPEELPKFYNALVNNYAEFANGSRLVYPMEKRAMKFLNMCANKTFGILFSHLLRQPVRDTLCGTKVLLRSDYEKIAQNRSYFGEFDPFGDFDLLFGASKLSLKILDVPIRYKDRTYGDTNIQRWRHGWLLLRMVLFAARRMKFIRQD